MDLATSESQYIVNKAKTATDPATAKAWILTAKKLYAQNFGVQFEAYRLEKIANNSEEAAKCFSYIIQTFQNQPADLWHEIAQLTAALRIPEGATTTEQEFYVKMFQHISYEVQHKILLLTANHSDNNLEHCRLILLLLKRFPQAIHTHSPRLLETLIQGITANQPTFRDMLVLEALPLLMFKPPDLPMALVNRIMAIVFEYYINQMLSNNKPDTSAIVVVAAAAAASSPPTECGGQTATSLCMTAGGGDAIADCWRKIFETLELCGRILKWEPYLGYNRDWSKDVYWQKLIQIVSTSPPRPAEHKQILFCATILFVHALQEYVHNVRPQKIDDTEVEYILVEQFNDAGANSGAASAAADLTTQRRKTDASMDAVPHISVVRPCTAETPICFVTAAQCWQLLHANELLQADFSKLLRSVPLSSWINRFLIDLAIYLGRSDEAHNLLKDSQTHGVEKHLRMMSLSMAQSTFNIQTFDLLMKILVDMPTVTGQWVNNRNAMGAPSTMSRRQLILLPVTKRAVLQYCTRIVVNALKQKLITDPACVTDSMLGNLLVMLQLNWPEDQHLAEQIFTIIRTKGHFIYLQFSAYIICVDMIEEFMSMWYPHGGDVHLEFVAPQPQLGARRIGTRGADKGHKDDFKQVMKQQILRCNDNIETIMHQFLTQEHMRLVQNIFEK